MAQGLIIAGGGLSGTLAAVALARARPDLALTLVEAAPTLGGNHTWSFYGSDLEGPAASLVEPFVAHRWEGYEVHFKSFDRTFSTPYRSVTSTRLDEIARARLGERVRLGTPVAALDARSVTLASGERLEADAVLDARGSTRPAGALLRWQKFLGQEVRLAHPHGLKRPTIMDARVPQLDGYRFVYLLPFSEDRLLIEDTYYSEDRAVDAPALRERILAYARSRGWTVEAVEREEEGALPLLLALDFETMWRHAAPPGGAIPLGLSAGLFHPVTGYSLPLAARTAMALAALEGPLSAERLATTIAAAARAHARRSGVLRLLNRLLFLAGEPHNRHKVLARFHGLPQPLIERFYASTLRRADEMRILVGKPPVPILAALRVLPERSAGEVG